MKALSIWQPWASLVATGEKAWETRGWYTKYRGPLAIHAGLKWTGELQLIACNQVFSSSLMKHGFTALHQLPLGAMLGIGKLVEILPTVSIIGRTEYAKRGNQTSRTLRVLSDQEIDFGDYTPGRFAWRIEMVEIFQQPIPARGAQGLFDWRQAA